MDRIFDKMFDEMSGGVFDGTFDGMYDGMCDGMLDSMLDGMLDCILYGRFDGMFDGRASVSVAAPVMISDGPGNYASNTLCEWVLSSSAASLNVSFTAFSTEPNYDKVWTRV